MIDLALRKLYTHKAEERRKLSIESVREVFFVQRSRATILTVFFFARSPEAPRTTMTVLSLSSTELHYGKSARQLSQKNKKNCIQVVLSQVVAPSSCAPFAAARSSRYFREVMKWRG